VNGPAYGDWLADVFDALRLERACVVGASWGGLIPLRGAARMPGRIQKLSLIAPADQVPSSPNTDRRARFLQHLITTRDPEWEAYLGDAVLGFRLDTKPVRLLKEGDLVSFTAPVQVLGAELDFQNPGRKLIERAKVVIPGLADSVLIPRSHHAMPFDDAFRIWLAGEVRRFLLGRPQSQDKVL